MMCFLFMYLLLISLLHLIIHFLFFPRRRLHSKNKKLTTLSLSSLKFIVISFFVFITFFTVTLFLEQFFIQSENQKINYSYLYGDGKFLPSLTTTEKDIFVTKNDIAESKKCISCHNAIGKQWLASTHRHAADDPTYVRNVNLLENSRGIEATRYCEGCHAPIALLTGQLTEGGVHGGVPNTVANAEGVSCMSCHGVNNIHTTQGVAAFNFKPRSPYLFEYSSAFLLNEVNQLAIKLRPQEHIRDLANPVINTSVFCSSCHSQFMDKSMNDWGWVKMQDEYLAWNESKFNQSRDSRFSHTEVKQCQSCHMPYVKGDDIAANERGEIRSHFFIGANVMLAKQFNNEELFLEHKKFLQLDKVSIYIVPPEDKLSQQSSFFTDPTSGVSNKFPEHFYRGYKYEITVLITNNGVGHNFPAGAIDLSEAWVEFIVLDGSQRVVYESGGLDESGSIIEGTTIYKETPIDRYGKHVWRHDLFNMVGRSYKNVIPSGATDLLKFNFLLPDWATSPITLSATLKYRKLNPKYMKWVEQEFDIVENPIVDIARNSRRVPLKKAPKVH